MAMCDCKTYLCTLCIRTSTLKYQETEMQLWITAAGGTISPPGCGSGCRWPWQLGDMEKIGSSQHVRESVVWHLKVTPSPCLPILIHKRIHQGRGYYLKGATIDIRLKLWIGLWNNKSISPHVIATGIPVPYYLMKFFFKWSKNLFKWVNRPGSDRWNRNKTPTGCHLLWALLSCTQVSW